MEIADIFNILNFDQNDTVCINARKGHMVDDEAYISSVVLIKSGEVEVKSLNGTLLQLLKSGSVYGVSNLFDEEKLHTRLCCLEDSTLIFVSKEVFRKKLLKNEEALILYCKFINSRLSFLLSRIDLLTQSTSREKVRLFLLSSKLEFSSRTQLASYLGIARSALFKELKYFEELGAIETKGHKIIIKNIDKLKENKSL
ncbi:MAG: Crp/Fnr family transcriptional regulator [Spirochaetales bacterium]|nr:Crp/Fnr family transcriptional regulator [Spirochaetales bacterium]